MILYFEVCIKDHNNTPVPRDIHSEQRSKSLHWYMIGKAQVSYNTYGLVVRTDIQVDTTTYRESAATHGLLADLRAQRTTLSWPHFTKSVPFLISLPILSGVKKRLIKTIEISRSKWHSITRHPAIYHTTFIRLFWGRKKTKNQQKDISDSRSRLWIAPIAGATQQDNTSPCTNCLRTWDLLWIFMTEETAWSSNIIPWIILILYLHRSSIILKSRTLKNSP